MHHHPARANALTGGIWMIGLGVLFATGYWWPGILLLIALTSLVQGWSFGRPSDGMHVAFWMILISVWAIFKFSVAFMFVALGVYMIFSAMVKPDIMRKPYVDNTLE